MKRVDWKHVTPFLCRMTAFQAIWALLSVTAWAQNVPPPLPPLTAPPEYAPAAPPGVDPRLPTIPPPQHALGATAIPGEPAARAPHALIAEVQIRGNETTLEHLIQSQLKTRKDREFDQIHRSAHYGGHYHTPDNSVSTHFVNCAQQ